MSKSKITTCACGQPTHPVIIPEYKYNDKIIKNVPAYACEDSSNCEHGGIMFESNVLEKVEDLLEEGKDTYK